MNAFKCWMTALFSHSCRSPAFIQLTSSYTGRARCSVGSVLAVYGLRNSAKCPPCHKNPSSQINANSIQIFSRSYHTLTFRSVNFSSMSLKGVLVGVAFLTLRTYFFHWDVFAGRQCALLGRELDIFGSLLRWGLSFNVMAF